MDWSRAKTYLIITFFLLDLLLGYQFFADRNQEVGSIQTSAEQLTEVKDLLQSRQLELAADVPQETPSLGFLHVQYAQVDARSVAEKWLTHPHMISAGNGQPLQVCYQGPQGKFTYFVPGRLVYDFSAPSITISPEDESLFDHLYGKMGYFLWKPVNYIGDRIIPKGAGETVVRYVQLYGKYPLFSAPLDVYIRNGRVTSIHQTVLQVLGQEESGQPVLPALGALQSLASSLEKKPASKQVRAIREIRLGYYSKPYNAESWYMTPVWQIIAGRDVYYVNALTGEVEKTEP